ncbi:MAG: hypothetical protein DMG99_15495 [Acidobacteria bacterium]|nr:MAG: hypothetical protein DMG99_15495 [Acidobacteriota bacterium]
MKKILFVLVGALLSTLFISAQESLRYPRIIHADVPLYPAIALAARVSGKVEAEFEVKAGNVIRAEARSGHPLLAKPAVENIRSWHFSPEAYGTFTVIFEYRIRGADSPLPQNPKIEMQLPAFVKITAPPIRPSCNDCEPGADIVGKPLKH